MRIGIDASYENKTLLSFIKTELRLSHRLLSRLKRTENGILVNGKNVTVRYILKSGDVLEMADGDIEPSETVEPVDISVDIIYESEDILAVNKPANMPTHPSHGHTNDTLANAAAFLYRGKNFVFRPINRLDRNTSGIVLIAKNQRAASFLSNALKNGEFEKTYIAAVDGRIDRGGEIEKHIKRTEGSIITRTVCSPDDKGAQYAFTEYSPISFCDTHSLLCVMPKTGRTHQIRVHLASIGSPICGDDLYGNGSPLIDRHALHAYSLAFPLLSGERVTLFAPLPDDMVQLASAAGLRIPEKIQTRKPRNL